MSDPVDLFIPSASRLGSLIYGRPGSGKSFAVQHALGLAMDRVQDPEWRVVAVSPKNEDYLGLLAKNQSPVATADEALESITRNRMTVVYPGPDVEDVVDDLIMGLFDLKADNPDFTCTVILDDAQTFVEARRVPSDPIKRLYLTGRSRGIVPISVSHSPVFSKLLDGNTGALWQFQDASPTFDRSSIERFDYDPATYRSQLQETPYSSVLYLMDGKPRLLRPLEVGRNASGMPTESPP